ncbi:MAG: hypothetical protein KAT68_13705 [Bacteroidales bacterium]|nr:hypothetical protein [Bacteroidales bacterium]
MKRKTTYIIFIFFLIVSCKPNHNEKFLKDLENIAKDDIEIYKIRNQSLMREFETLYIQNPNKNRPFFEISRRTHKYIKVCLNQIYNQKSDNSQIEASDSLITSVNELIDLLKATYIDSDGLDKKIRLLTSKVEKLLTVKCLSKEEFKYLLTHLEIGIYDLEFETLNYLESIIDYYDFRFNKLLPVFVTNNNPIKIDELFIAEIHLSAIDTTIDYEVYIAIDSSNNTLIEMQAGIGIYRIIPRTKGNKSIKGFYRYRTKYGENIDFPFDFKYTVK